MTYLLRTARILSLAISAVCFIAPASRGQSPGASTEAAAFVAAKQWDKAIPLLRKAYEAAPGNNDLYQDWLSALLESKDYKGAEELIQTHQRYNNNPQLLIDLGHVYALSGKEKKAAERYDAAVQAVNGDEIAAQQLAASFSAISRDDYAIKVYERARGILQNPYLFTGSLSKLYAKTGDVAKAIDAMLNTAPFPSGSTDDTKANMLEMLGSDPAKLQVAQKAILRRINLQPENTYYAELLTWLYTQKGDWEGALMQIQAIDERTKAGGLSLLQFAQTAQKEGQYAIALKSLDAIIEGGANQPYFTLAKAQRLNIAQTKLEANPTYAREEVTALVKEYEAFLVEFPQYNASEMIREYAMIEARYNNNPAKAIALLQTAISQPMASKEFVGRSKLQIGDYQILEGKVWEASLTYSQVDKAFREDMLGEDARFRNGKLAYYRGDFGWAQAQLSALKASTSELIANDALNLSVLITENTPDSNTAALLQFARADLFLFQNKDAEALKQLDSIAAFYPKHPLQDDVLLLRATLAQKRRDYTVALGYLERIYKEFGKDVLGDDAVFRTAEIYERAVKDTAKAKDFYEQLIIDYPGSTYVQIARTRLQALAAEAPRT